MSKNQNDLVALLRNCTDGHDARYATSPPISHKEQALMMREAALEIEQLRKIINDKLPKPPGKMYWVVEVICGDRVKEARHQPIGDVADDVGMISECLQTMVQRHLSKTIPQLPTSDNRYEIHVYTEERPS